MTSEPGAKRADALRYWALPIGLLLWFYAVGIFALVVSNEPTPLAGIVIGTPVALLFGWAARP